MSGDWAFSGLIDYVKVCKLLGYEIVCKAIVSSSQKLVSSQQCWLCSIPEIIYQ